MARNQKNEVSFVIHNLPVIAKMGAVAKACGNMFQLSQGHSPETSGGLLICLPREQAAAYCKVISLDNFKQAWLVPVVYSERQKSERSDFGAFRFGSVVKSFGFRMFIV